MTLDDITHLSPVEEERHLGSLLLSQSQQAARNDALARVDPSDFSDTRVGALWAVARQMVDDGQRVTARALKAADVEGFKPGVLARVVDGLTGTLDPAALVEDSITTVTSCAARRRIVATCHSVTQWATTKDPGDAIQHAYELLAALEDRGEVTSAARFDTLMARWWESLEEDHDTRVFPTPWGDLNEKLNGGLRPGRFYVVGARPGAGKSLMGHGAALHHAQQGGESLVFSAEMGRAEVAGRLLAAGSRVELSEITRGDLSGENMAKAAEFIDSYSHIPLTVNDRERIDMGYVRAECRRHKARHGLDLVVIDYLQLVGATDQRLPRQEQVARISRDCKLLSRELDIAVVVPCQLNRESTRRGDGRPTMADLRESGGIEADADGVWLLARGVVEDGQDKGMFTDELHVFVDKNRHGSVGQLTLRWMAHYAAIGE